MAICERGLTYSFYTPVPKYHVLSLKDPANSIFRKFLTYLILFLFIVPFTLVDHLSTQLLCKLIKPVELGHFYFKAVSKYLLRANKSSVLLLQ